MVIAVVLVVGWLVYLVHQLRQRPGRGRLGDRARARTASPTTPTKSWKGPKLERTQILGLAMLVVIAIGLPLVLARTSRAGRPAPSRLQRAVRRLGRADFATTADGGFNCAGCHGGMKATGGGRALHHHRPDAPVRSRRSTGRRRPSTPCSIGSSTDEVIYILTYGRPFSPMSPWGVVGGGPMDDQQITNLIAYLAVIQIPMAGCRTASICDPATCRRRPGAACRSRTLRRDPEGGRGRRGRRHLQVASVRRCSTSTSNGGAYSCARCHTRAGPTATRSRPAAAPWARTSPAASTVRQFPNDADQVDFI